MAVLRARLAAFFVAGALAAPFVAAGPVVLGPRSPGADKRLEQTVALLAEGKLKQADALLSQAFGEDTRESASSLARAQVAINQQRLGDAERTVSSAIAKNPTFAAGHAMKGVILLLEKKPDEARTSLRRAVELEPRYVTPRFYLALIARSKGDYAGAAAEYKALSEADPSKPAGYIGQAEAQMMLRNDAEAFRILEAWKAAPGAGSSPSYVIANLRLARGENAAAIRKLEPLVAKNPGDSVAWTLLGDAYVATGDQRKAADSYRAALKADPGSAVAGNNLAWVLAEQKQLDEALRLAQAATQRDPAYVDAADTLGWIHFQRGEYVDAAAALAKASKLAPNRLDVAAHLGLAYAKVGERALALKELDRALAAKTPLPNRSELQRVAAELKATSK